MIAGGLRASVRTRKGEKSKMATRTREGLMQEGWMCNVARNHTANALIKTPRGAPWRTGGSSRANGNGDKGCDTRTDGRTDRHIQQIHIRFIPKSVHVSVTCCTVLSWHAENAMLCWQKKEGEVPTVSCGFSAGRSV